MWMVRDGGSQMLDRLTGHAIVPVGEPAPGGVDHRHALSNAWFGNGQSYGCRQTRRTRTDHQCFDIGSGQWSPPRCVVDQRQPARGIRGPETEPRLTVRRLPLSTGRNPVS